MAMVFVVAKRTLVARNATLAKLDTLTFPHAKVCNLDFRLFRIQFISAFFKDVNVVNLDRLVPIAMIRENAAANKM